MAVVKVTSRKLKFIIVINLLIYAKNCFLGQAIDMQLPVRHLDTTQVLDFLNHLLFKNIKTELGIDPSELIVAHLFDELN